MSKAIDHAIETHTRLVAATKVVRAYAGSDCSKHVIEMLDALGQSYYQDLVNVTPEGLIQLQTSLKQIYAIRSVLSNDGIDIPKI